MSADLSKISADLVKIFLGYFYFSGPEPDAASRGIVMPVAIWAEGDLSLNSIRLYYYYGCSYIFQWLFQSLFDWGYLVV